MSLFSRDPEHDDPDLRAEVMQERRRRARMNHWCDICLGNLGPGSPCAPEEDEPQRSCADGCNGCDECTDYDEEA